MEATVYILRCADGAYYTGLTKQPIEARVWEHNEGIYPGFTKPRRPVTLVFTETYDRLLDAIARERQIKGWSRAKKEALIALHYHRLPELSRNRTGETRGASFIFGPIRFTLILGFLILSLSKDEPVEGELVEGELVEGEPLEP